MLGQVPALVIPYRIPSVFYPELDRICDQDTLSTQIPGPRKGILVQFLHHSKLITREEAIISLELADLTRSDLSGANLTGADLSHSNLNLADLYDADLSRADLYRSVLGGEQLAKAKTAIGARTPDGKTMTQELWRIFRENPWEFPPSTDGT